MGKAKKFLRPQDQMVELCKNHREGSNDTQRERAKILFDAMQDIKKVSEYKQLEKIENLKQKHITWLVEHWQREGRGIGTIKNRLSHLRWAADKLGKRGLIPTNNDALGVESRTYITNENKAWAPPAEIMERLDERHKLHLELAHKFGLRFDEAAKVRPESDMAEQHLLVTRGTKGGRERKVPIRTAEQRELLERLRVFCGREGSACLIPVDKTGPQFEKSARKVYEGLGITKQIIGTCHGLRHDYAQRRYRELTGRDRCPCEHSEEERKAVKGAMTREERERDALARLEIAEELGHGRAEITAQYIGSWGR